MLFSTEPQSVILTNIFQYNVIDFSFFIFSYTISSVEDQSIFLWVFKKWFSNFSLLQKKSSSFGSLQSCERSYSIKWICKKNETWNHSLLTMSGERINSNDVFKTHSITFNDANSAFSWTIQHFISDRKIFFSPKLKRDLFQFSFQLFLGLFHLL